MRLTGRALMALGLMIISAGMVITASTWPLKAALFPMASIRTLSHTSFIPVVGMICGVNTSC